MEGGPPTLGPELQRWEAPLSGSEVRMRCSNRLLGLRPRETLPLRNGSEGPLPHRNDMSHFPLRSLAQSVGS